MHKKRLKQAVLLVHGIGEQRPMGTIRDFVEAVFLRNDSLEHCARRIWVKPEPKFPIHELRRITTSAISSANEPSSDIRTDFFELYWQDLMRGSRFSHVADWIRPLMLRWPWKMPSKLIPVWMMLWMALPVVLALMLVPTFLVLIHSKSIFWFLLAFLLLLLIGTLHGLLRHYVGDAARYFDHAPRNVGVRNLILNRGVDLLEQIQADPQYDRIVIVGHSLGSVIAYDILSICWSRTKRRRRTTALSEDPIREMEHFQVNKHDSVQEMLVRKRNLFKWLSAPEAAAPWKVSDFVTLGSPLRYASVLLARDDAEFRQRISERYLATDPPQTEFFAEVDGHTFCYPDQLSASPETIWRMHHAAQFAAIRWSNLYTPSRWLIGGDMIGGPLRGLFGRWISDIPVEGVRGLDPAAHVHYWSPNGQPERLKALRNALDLERNTFPSSTPA